MDNKLEKGKNFRVEGSLDSDATSKQNPDNQLKGEQLKENQKDKSAETPSGANFDHSAEEEVKRNSTESGNSVSVSNP